MSPSVGGCRVRVQSAVEDADRDLRLGKRIRRLRLEDLVAQDLSGQRLADYQRGDVIIIRQIRDLLYEQGFTIGGARQLLEGQEGSDDNTAYRQLIRQSIVELEEVLAVLKAP